MSGNATKSTDLANPKDAIGEKKPPLGLIPAAALIHEAMVMRDGATKYGPYNWRGKKVRYTVYVNAALRHLLAALDGEEVASDSKRLHLAHARACLGILIDAKETGNLIDDRPAPGAAGRLIGELTEKASMYDAWWKDPATMQEIEARREGRPIMGGTE